METPDPFETYFVTGLVQSTVALLLNLVILICNAPSLQNLTPSSFLIFWLGICDGAIDTINIYMSVSQLSDFQVDFNHSHCEAIGSLITLFGLAGLGCVSGLTFFRYLVVVKQWNLSARFAPLYVLCAFASSALVAYIPFVFGFANFSYGIGTARVTCTIAWNDKHLQTYIIAGLCVIMLFFPLVCVCFAYGSIYFVVRKSVQEIDSHHVRMSVPRESFVQTQNTVSSLERNTLERPNQNKVSVVASVRPSGARRRAREVDETQALLVQSIVLVVVFVVGWTPFMCKALYEMATSERVSPEVDYWTDFVVVLMHLCNPILVLVYNLEMRQNVVLAFYYFHKST